jgi:hypothetical protein
LTAFKKEITIKKTVLFPGGKTYKNFTEFKNSIKLKKLGKRSSIYARKEGFFHVIGYLVEYSEPFPCFDSSDYIYEDRYSSEFFFVDSYEEAKRLYKDFEKEKYDSNIKSEYERLSFVRNDPYDKSIKIVTKESHNENK